MKEGLINYQQGMLLKPQHFQLESRFHEENLHRISLLLKPYLYGAINLNLSVDALAAQKVIISEGSFLFGDGSFCEVGSNSLCNSRIIPSEELELGKIVSVYVCLKNFSNHDSNVSNINSIDELDDCNARYVSQYGGEEFNDLYGNGISSSINVIKYNLRILFDSELEKVSDYDTIKIAEIYRDGTRIILNNEYVSPTLNFFSTDTLANILNDISSLVVSKTRQFEKYKHVRANSTLSGYEIMLLNLVSVLCDCAAKVQILQESEQIHPYDVWKSLTQIVATLSAYCDTLSAVDEERRFPKYDHENLFKIFSIIRNDIRTELNALSVGPEYIIRFTRTENNIWVADLPDLTKLERINAYLAMSGEGVDVNTITLNFYQHIKFASRDALQGLIVRSLSGIPLALTTNIPGGLPSLDRGFYSCVDIHNDLWLDMVEVKSAAMLWDGPQDAQLVMYITRGQ